MDGSDTAPTLSQQDSVRGYYPAVPSARHSSGTCACIIEGNPEPRSTTNNNFLDYSCISMSAKSTTKADYEINVGWPSLMHCTLQEQRKPFLPAAVPRFEDDRHVTAC